LEKKIEERLYDFALRIIEIVRMLPKDMVAHEIGKQLLRSGTSIAANYEEAKGAFSREDFTYKIAISFKEARETNLWLRLLRDSKLTTGIDLDDSIRESTEIRNILGKSVSTAKKNKK
jgi:four helix bundle protein